jgi:uncharacterized protein (DUF924 family)
MGASAQNRGDAPHPWRCYDRGMLRLRDAGRAAALLDFWFGPEGSPGRERPRLIWFEPGPGFDAALRRRFARDGDRAAAGLYDHWQTAPDTCLALVLLLDQLPRNLHRGSRRAYANDAKALAVARLAIKRGLDRRVPPVWRWFFYLPFMHCEALADQEAGLALYSALPPCPGKRTTLAAARHHRDIIARFGRFPHRNRILGRVSTAAETRFLQQPGASF